MRQLEIDNYIIDEDMIKILRDIQCICSLKNGKLKDIITRGDDIVVTCPNSEHKNGLEKTPDCNIYIGDNRGIPYGYARCFACGFAVSFEKFVANCFDSTIDYAKQWLIKNYGVLAKEKISIGDDIDLTKNTYKKPKVKDKKILDAYQSYCPYLAKRKVSREIAEKFLVKYDQTKHHIVFPSFDEKGNLVAINRRSVDYKFFILDKDSPKVVYGLDHILKENISEVLITEGQFDCLVSWSFGQPAIATLGGMSNEQIEKINNSCITHIFTAFDNDEAGRRFTQMLKNKLNKRILISEISIPNGYKDVADLDKETFTRIIENARKN